MCIVYVREIWNWMKKNREEIASYRNVIAEIRHNEIESYSLYLSNFPLYVCIQNENGKVENAQTLNLYAMQRYSCRKFNLSANFDR